MKFNGCAYVASVFTLVVLSALPQMLLADATRGSETPTPSTSNERFLIISMPANRRQALERRIGNKLEGIINTFWRERGGVGGFQLSARFSEAGDELIVDPGAAFLSANDRGATRRARQTLAVPQYDERAQWLENAAYTALEKEGLSTAIARVRLLFDGRDYYFYFPDERPLPHTNVSTQPEDAAQTSSTSGPVVVSAGHGLYAYHGFSGNVDWITQRAEANGIVEDFVTPLFATDVKSAFQQRSPSIPVVLARSDSSTDHAPSVQAWWKVAARGHLEAILPSNAEIWRSRGNEKPGPQNEYHQDIRSRPRYANFLGATALISLHTNGDADAAVSGARVYVAPDRTGDFQMAENMLCHMKQVVNAVPAYASFKVDGTPRTANHGENTAAQMPAIVVEAAFHTNPSDALAIQDTIFRTAIAKGIERGFRRHQEGRPCSAFGISSIPSVSIRRGTTSPVRTHFAGTPQFPVVAKIAFPSCPTGSTCTPGQASIPQEVASPLSWNFSCGSGGSGTTSFEVRVTLVDADGVTTPPVDASVSCT